VPGKFAQIPHDEEVSVEAHVVNDLQFVLFAILYIGASGLFAVASLESLIH
jgi:hypothetical protein